MIGINKQLSEFVVMHNPSVIARSSAAEGGGMTKQSQKMGLLRFARNDRVKYLVLMFLFLPALVLAKDINFEASVEQSRVAVGQRVQLNLAFEDTKNIPALSLPEIDGFQVQYMGPSTRMSIINGQVSSAITHMYSLIPLQEGKFKIGSFDFNYNGDTYHSNPLEIEVVKDPSPVQSSPGQDQPSPVAEISDRIFLILQPAKNKVYLNEVVPVTVKLYVNKLAVRDIQFPQIAHEGFSVGEMPQPKQYQEVLGGVTYEVIEFSTSVFPMRFGELALGPAAMKCNLISRRERKRNAPSGLDSFFDSGIFEDFFGGYESHPIELKSADVPFTVMDLPQAAKPGDFNGAVGNFDFEVSLKPVQVKVGDPVTLQMTVRGQGNLNTVTNPGFSAAANPDFKVYEPEVKQAGNAKTFEQVIMPMSQKVKEVTQLKFTFFDPDSGEYQTISRGPFALMVTAPDKDEESRIIEPAEGGVMRLPEEKLGRDIIYIKESAGLFNKSSGFLYTRHLFLWMLGIPFLSYLAILFLRKRSEKLRVDLRYARKLIAPKKAKAGITKAKRHLVSLRTKEFYDTVFDTLQEYLGDRFHLPSKGITAGVIDEAFKGRDIDPRISGYITAIFKECDMIRYAASELGKEQMSATLERLKEVIDYFQRTRV